MHGAQEEPLSVVDMSLQLSAVLGTGARCAALLLQCLLRCSGLLLCRRAP